MREVRVERAARLRRYLRKDYTQLVDFPVEIVGRDGMVRRYSFDDSVRLYQRRIHSAPLRYDDDTLIQAEIRHCRQRIDQLRRSYLEHFGWGELRQGRIGGLVAGPLAADVAAFLRRAFSGEADGPTALRITLLESGVGDVYYVSGAQSGRSWMLYAWRIDGDGPAGARQDWRATADRLAAAPEADGVERMLLLSEGLDMAMILAGTGDWSGPKWSVGALESSAQAEPVDEFHAGVRALYDGNTAEALVRFERGLEGPAPRAVFAPAAAIVALLEGQAERAEFAARFGRHGRPGDTLLVYLLGVALARQRRWAEADAVVGEVGGAARVGLVALLAGLLALRRGRLLSAWIELRGASSVVASPFAARAARGARRAIAAAVTTALAVGASGAAAVEAHVAGAPWSAVVLVALGLTAAAIATFNLSVWVRALSGTSANGPRLVSLELLPREREPDGDN